VGPDGIIAKMRAIRDVRIRTLALVEALTEGEPVSWVEALASIIARAHIVDDPDVVEMVETLTHAIADPALPYKARQGLYAAAVERNLPAIARLFLVASPKNQLPPTLKKQLGPERALRPTDRPMTLGERKALARTHRREKLTLLVRDPHPQVVAIVLDNPHITEQDVMKMASARPAVPDSLALIANHTRWSVRHAVKRALVLNPSTPLADAIRIATTLRSPELVELAGDASLPEQLRRHATEVLANLTSRPRA
jgi:hypothetical protein